MYKTATGSTVANYSTYWDCYSAVKKASGSNVKEISSNMKDLLQTIEDEFNCNGICNPSGIFYFFQKVQSGPPSKSCINGIKDAFRDKPLAIGIILLVACFLTLLTFLTVYGLCCKKHKHGKSHH